MSKITMRTAIEPNKTKQMPEEQLNDLKKILDGSKHCGKWLLNRELDDYKSKYGQNDKETQLSCKQVARKVTGQFLNGELDFDALEKACEEIENFKQHRWIKNRDMKPFLRNVEAVLPGIAEKGCIGCVSRTASAVGLPKAKAKQVVIEALPKILDLGLVIGIGADLGVGTLSDAIETFGTRGKDLKASREQALLRTAEHVRSNLIYRKDVDVRELAKGIWMDFDKRIFLAIRPKRDETEKFVEKLKEDGNVSEERAREAAKYLEPHRVIALIASIKEWIDSRLEGPIYD